MMRAIAAVMLLLVASAPAQEPTSQTTIAQSETTTESMTMAQSVTVPADTHIAMTLNTPLSSKQLVPGADVRGVTSFPIAVGNTVAIPVGTFANGKLISTSKKNGKTELVIHFTQLIYPNGYTVNLDGSNFNAAIQLDELQPLQLRAEPELIAANGGAPQVRSSSSGASMPGPNPVVIIVPMLATVAAVVITGMLVHRNHMKNADYVVYDSGWQFEMVLNQPLTIELNKAGVTGAVATQ